MTSRVGVMGTASGGGDHDAIKRNRIMISLLFEQKTMKSFRTPVSLSDSWVSVVAGRFVVRRHGRHDDDKPEHHASHEFEYQRVHAIPHKPLDL